MIKRNHVLDQTHAWDSFLLLDINMHDKNSITKAEIEQIVYGDDKHEPWPSTDIDAGRWISHRLINQAHFVSTSSAGGNWYFWNGALHEYDESEQLDDQLAQAFADALKKACNKLKAVARKSGLSDDDMKPLASVKAYAERLRSEAGLSRLRSRLRREFGVEPGYFDKDQQWAVLSDGRVIDLYDIEEGINILDPDPKRPVTRALGATLSENLNAATPRWTKALNQWLPSKEEQKYLQMAAGAALLGRGDAKNIVALVGVSNTGKSTYLNIIKGIFGGYQGQLPSTAIVQKYGGNTNFEQAKARGVRLLWLSEPQNTRTDDAFLENLAGGGETITTASKGKDSVDWHAQCVLHIASNHTPRIDTKDGAIVDRINIVAFNNVFKPGPGKVIGLDKQILADEAEGILLWILAGAGMYIKNGRQIIVPDSIKQRGQDNVVESSVSLRWLYEMIADGAYTVDTGVPLSHMVTPKEAYQSFQDWCFSQGETRVPTKKVWQDEIEALTKRPASVPRDKRSMGNARVWGVMHSKSAKPTTEEADEFWSMITNAQ